MGNLLVSLLNSANALEVYNQALATTENNVLNASTVGYARQVQVLRALPFDLSAGLPGGVGAGKTVSTRNAFAEQAVRGQQSQLGYQKQIATDLKQLENYFDPTSKSSISASLDALFNSFSQLSVNPNDTVSRQAVLDQAAQTVQSIRHTALGIGATKNDVDDETRATVDAINSLGGQIAEINTQRRNNAASGMDAGVDAALNASLEDLSQYVDFKAIQQPGGAVTVYLAGQMPLVIDDQFLPLQVDFSSPQTAILDGHGADITRQLQSGKLGGLLQVKNTALPSYMDGLNRLAQSVADQVNTTLAQGYDQSNNYPATDLFTYDAAVGAALTIDVSNMTPDQIAAALPNAPGGNGNALALAQLATAKSFNGYSFSQFYGSVAAGVGRDLSNATDQTTTNQQLLTQAQSLRSELSSVSLDREATNLIAFQRAYQATSKLVTILNDLTETVINILR